MEHHASSPLCFACKRATDGVFTYAHKLAAKIDELNRRETADETGAQARTAAPAPADRGGWTKA